MTRDAMQSILPGQTVPYVLKAGEGVQQLVAGQVVRMLAGTAETNGAYGVVVCTAPTDPRPIPMHWHAREHDTWFCTRGKLQVWCGDQSRVLLPGDFAYVKPGDTHSYQSIAPTTEFFGVVAPGGWEQFFVDAGEPWASTFFPPQGYPFDFSRMGGAMRKHGVMLVDNAVFGSPPATTSDHELPGRHASFFLQAGFGPHYTLSGHVSSPLLTGVESDNLFAMELIEAGRDVSFRSLTHQDAHKAIYLLNGELHVALDGQHFVMHAGDYANIPAGYAHATRTGKAATRWISVTSGGSAGQLFQDTGQPTANSVYPIGGADAGD
jgi:quercetin dioxygenase-like cupin family protein